jgi:hypothetical protein
VERNPGGWAAVAQWDGVLSMAGLLIQGVTQDRFAPLRGPLGSSPDRESATGNAPALVPGLLASL